MVATQITGIEYAVKSHHPSNTCRWLGYLLVEKLTVMRVHVVMGSALMMLQVEQEDTEESTCLLCTVTHYPQACACHAITPGWEAEEEEERLYGLARRHVKMPVHAKDASLRIYVRLRAVMAVMMLALMTLTLASLSLGCVEKQFVRVCVRVCAGACVCV